MITDTRWSASWKYAWRMNLNYHLKTVLYCLHTSKMSWFVFLSFFLDLFVILPIRMWVWVWMSLCLSPETVFAGLSALYPASCTVSPRIDYSANGNQQSNLWYVLFEVVWPAVTSQPLTVRVYVLFFNSQHMSFYGAGRRKINNGSIF